MKRYLCIGAVMLYMVLSVSKVDAQITANVFERVLNIRVNGGTDHEESATAFTIDVDGREYLITAKHAVKSLKAKDSVDIFVKDAWKPIQFDILLCEDPVDIAILIPPYQLTVNLELPFDIQNFAIGQDAYFLGFPYGIQAPAGGLNGPYPFAIVKKGTLSGQIVLDFSKKATMILLDGYNNPGFSGGPIVYRDINQGQIVLKLAGVVSGFIPEVVPAMKEHDIRSPEQANEQSKAQPWRIRKRRNKTFFEYVDTDQAVALNTGIVQGYLIGPAIELIRKHPTGPLTKDLPGNTPIPSQN